MSDSFGVRSVLHVGDREYQIFRLDGLEDAIAEERGHDRGL